MSKKEKAGGKIKISLPPKTIEDSITLNEVDMANFVDNIQNPKPRNKAFEQAATKFKRKYKKEVKGD